MPRGNRRGDIYFRDGDRRCFLGSLGQAREGCGFRVHAYVLMSNHYHLLLETPEANLADGMGWLQEQKLLALAGSKLKDRRKRRADGYHGPDIADHSQEQARRLIECGLRHLSLGRAELSALAKSDWRKALIGEVVQATTLAKLDWISSELHMGTRPGTCRAIQEMKKCLPNERTLRKLRDEILRTGNIL